VRDLEYQAVQDQLDRQVSAAATAVRLQECFTPNVPVATGTCRPAPAEVFRDRLNAGAARLGSGRLLLLDGERYVVYDSADSESLGTRIDLTQSARFTNVFEARANLGDQEYLAAAMKLPGKRVDPLGRPSSSWRSPSRSSPPAPRATSPRACWRRAAPRWWSRCSSSSWSAARSHAR